MTACDSLPAYLGARLPGSPPISGRSPSGRLEALMVALSGPGWRLAHSLVTLDAQVDARWPGRDHASDGTIGDVAHQREGAPAYDGAGFGISGSDHDPDNLGVVCALDIDSGPGIDPQALVDAITAEPDPRIAYVIWNRQIFSSRSGSAPWAWRAYGGSDPHTNHVHVSVRHGAVGDNGATWQIDSNPTPPAPPILEADVFPIILTSPSGAAYLWQGAGVTPFEFAADADRAALQAAGARNVPVTVEFLHQLGVK